MGRCADAGGALVCERIGRAPNGERGTCRACDRMLINAPVLDARASGKRKTKGYRAQQFGHLENSNVMRS